MAKKKKEKLPVRNKMNLYQPIEGSKDYKIRIACIIAAILVVGVFAKVLIVDKIVEIQDLQYEIESLQYSYDNINMNLQKYPEVKEDHYRYSDVYRSGTQILIDRITLLSLLEDVTLDLGQITSTSVVDNQVSIKILTSDLDKLKYIKERLEESELVSHVSVYSAQRGTGDVISSVVFNCIVTEEE